MKTLVIYPIRVFRAEGYHQTDAGDAWGPLRPILPDPRTQPPLQFPQRLTIPTGYTFESFVQKMSPLWTMEPTTLHAGEYYPRISRTGVDRRFGETFPLVEDTTFLSNFVNALEQIEGLFNDLLSIFRVLHPAASNLGAYGGELRNILILACTEVEAQWKAVLDANKPQSGHTRYTTAEYAKLLPVLKLNEYRLSLIRYPEIATITPFASWNPQLPTRSLAWYDAYNQVKHDRETHFDQASLKNVIDAVAACVVMLAAQFGVDALHRHQLKPVFAIMEYPKWPPKDWYFEPIPKHSWRQVPCPM